MPLRDMIPVLQVAIGPVILISGVGLLLLSMTNRLGRLIDRSRQLALASRSADGHERQVLQAQLDILSTRAVLVQQAITLATVSLLCAAILVITLFLAALLHLEFFLLVAILFIACMGALIGSLVAFLRDVHLSLAALKLELAARRQGESAPSA